MPVLHRLLPLLAVCALALAAGGAGAAPAARPGTSSSGSTSAPAVSTVRLSIRIETTSDWTKVLVAPGRVAATRVVTAPLGTEVISGSRGWEVRPPAGGTVELDAVFDDASSATSYAVEVQKGAVGTAKVTLRNTTASRPTTVLTTTNRRSSADDPTNTVRTVAPRRALLGATQLVLPRADQRRLTLAFYYPWFSGGYASPQLSDRPARPRSTATAAGVRSMTEQARRAGVDGFVVSFSGDQRDGAELDLAMSAAAATRGVVAPYLETTEAAKEAAATGRTTLQVVQTWLGQLLARSGSPAALKAGGETVVFVWDAEQLSPEQWAALLELARATGRPLRLVTDALEPEYDPVSWGRHRYVVNGALPALAADHRQLAQRLHAPAALDRAVPPGLYAATVSPGYDDTALRGDATPVVPRGASGERYAGSWRAATSSRPDWVLVNSWNEWFEGTSIEPSAETGDRALRQTAERTAAWRASS